MRRSLPFSIMCGLLLAGVPAAVAQPHAGTDARIQNAMSAAPPSIADHATIMEWPAGHGEPMTVLRKGTNVWTCMPDMPHTPGNDPMCVDAPWLEFINALGSKRAPVIGAMGFGYMLQANDSPFSNTDPFATGPTPDNDWHELEGPHLMILVPDAKLLEGMSTDPGSGGPYVMFPNTPYAHIMAPMPQYTPEKR